MTPRPRKNAKTIRAVAYVRVSSEQQADSGLSLEYQQQKCRASLDRPGMARVLAMVNARQVEAVLIASWTGLPAVCAICPTCSTHSSRRHVTLVSVSESLNTETAGGRMYST